MSENNKTKMQDAKEFDAVVAFVQKNRKRVYSCTWFFGSVNINGVLCGSLAEVKAVLS